MYHEAERILVDEDKLYKEARDIPGIDRYLRKYPNGRYAKELEDKKRKLTQLKSDDNSSNRNTINSSRELLRAKPGTRRAPPKR